MTRRDAIKLLKSEKEIVAINAPAYLMFLSLGLELLHKGVYPVAKVSKGFDLTPDCTHPRESIIKGEVTCDDCRQRIIDSN